ncbi:hypothetical protein N7493_000972 [Penicillium malachiteum]|uniref:Uncharacterized protein n=1 Tax=Penicillium malachiteum TaxID=1324776 RepID=A0AAD6N1X4_9EURO|nr:hypothetical protein N7493_000972 [Penicillium malachiteum]
MGNFQIADLLISEAADPEQKSDLGLSALMTAIAYDQVRFAILLMERNVDNEARLGYAEIQDEHLGIYFEGDKRRSLGSTPLILASLKGQSEVVEYLINQGVNINSKTEHGITAVIAAAWAGHSRVVEILLINHCPLDAIPGDGFTALHYGALKGHVNVVRLLCESGANIEQTKSLGFTPLLEAALKGNSDVVELLLRYGANPSSVAQGVYGMNGFTALHLAAIIGHTRMATLLIENGCDFEIKTSEGFTALEIAEGRGHREIMRIIHERTNTTRGGKRMCVEA